MTAHQPFKKNSLVPGTAYRVTELIGSGGMGSVYRVEHTELGKLFVLKALHVHLSARHDLVARMRNEWRALAKLNHPNIVQVTDAGMTASNLPFYVMEYLEGATVGQLVMEDGRLPLRMACGIISDVLAGLGAAHGTGAVHRDIKPQNIFVEASGRTKLLDFGIAKLRDQVAKVVTAGGVSIGTPRFMAPEQAEGTKVDGRADIYAAALVLYQVLVGKGPFAHISDPNELVMAHITIDPERADSVDPNLPVELADLLQRWLSKVPSSRPPSAQLARRELMALVEAFPDDVDPLASEVTWAGGIYDVSTFGAERPDESRAEATRSREVFSRSAATHGGGITEMTRAVESGAKLRLEEGGITTQTVAFRDDDAESKGTLTFGTQPEAASTITAPRPRSGKRPSFTPPPISQHHASSHGRAPGRFDQVGRNVGRLGNVGWAVVTAVITFMAAWGISRAWSDSAPGAAEPAEPARSEQNASSPADRDRLESDIPSDTAPDSGGEWEGGEPSSPGPSVAVQTPEGTLDDPESSSVAADPESRGITAGSTSTSDSTGLPNSHKGAATAPRRTSPPSLERSESQGAALPGSGL